MAYIIANIYIQGVQERKKLIVSVPCLTLPGVGLLAVCPHLQAVRVGAARLQEQFFTLLIVATAALAVALSQTSR